MRGRLKLGGWLAALALIGAWPATPSGAQTDDDQERYVHYRRMTVATSFGDRNVLVTYPRRHDRREHPPGERYPIMVALHGQTEALSGPRRGHLGWAFLYRLPTALNAVLRGRLTRDDYQRHVREEHLAYVNAMLRAQPFRGVAVVTPYMPNIGGPVGSDAVAEYGDWLAGPLLAAVRERFPGLAQTRDGTGIDGISLGGRVALEVGFRHPDAFGVVGGMQPAIRNLEGDLGALALDAAHARPQRVRLLSSVGDPFLWATRHLSSDLRERRIPHTLTVVPGPHDYEFNRGPASIELLLYSDAALLHEPVDED
ncbi:MAG: esterase [Sandaracinaceae bacterium]|nr:esterase [Sandaracinaceae bacterium]